LAVVYPIGNNSVDFDYVVAELCARFFDETDSVGG